MKLFCLKNKKNGKYFTFLNKNGETLDISKCALFQSYVIALEFKEKHHIIVDFEEVSGKRLKRRIDRIQSDSLKILKEYNKLFGTNIRFFKIKSQTRKMDIVHARHYIWSVLKLHYGYSYPMIANSYKKTHATIIYAVDKMLGNVKIYPDVKDDFNILIYNLKC